MPPENASCPISALVRDGPANHAREPGRDIMQKEFSNESHSWRRSCVEEQCECFNVRGHAIQNSACGMSLSKRAFVLLRHAVPGLHASLFRVLKLPVSPVSIHSRICHLSCIKRVFPGKQVVLEIKGRTNGLVSHSSKLFSIL
ncbi:hypothetical protein CEXT_537861 [Caerostris extrusa]|uniref:Uncharacterized protein n=1 Tax=Caerostris extrusa TaxID=172846 RepID=A0AAV4MS73_CAEEX|nr:hypothetical protein CEXT_537861 [Caerostris extrusa]